MAKARPSIGRGRDGHGPPTTHSHKDENQARQSMTLSSRLILMLSVVAFPYCLAICLAISLQRQAHRLLWSSPCLGKKAIRHLIVLVPSFNVAATIERALKDVRTDPRTALVVVVDGGSTDGTADAARAFAGSQPQAACSNKRAAAPVVVVEATDGVSGRANCLNLAACVATEWLTEQHAGTAELAGEQSDDAYLFLHADTVLPEGFGSAVVEALEDGRAAYGSFKIFTRGVRDSPSFLVRSFSRFANQLNNLRSSWMEAPYGDQGLFCRRSTFERVGGFPSVPLMEDSAFCWEARKHGSCCILRDHVQSFASPQWGALGALYVLRNYFLLTMWAIGVLSPEHIHELYYVGRRLPQRIAYSEMACQYGKTPQELLRNHQR